MTRKLARNGTVKPRVVIGVTSVKCLSKHFRGERYFFQVIWSPPSNSFINRRYSKVFIEFL